MARAGALATVLAALTMLACSGGGGTTLPDGGCETGCPTSGCIDLVGDWKACAVCQHVAELQGPENMVVRPLCGCRFEWCWIIDGAPSECRPGCIDTRGAVTTSTSVKDWSGECTGRYSDGGIDLFCPFRGIAGTCQLHFRRRSQPCP